jgi:hypothetical protein
MKKKLLIIELNEFSIDFLKKYKQFKYINRFLNLKKINYYTNDNVQGEDLDPWVQWVSVHTGVSSNIHKVYRLGDIPNNTYNQLWELKNLNHLKIGLWGLMNASKGTSNNCNFFVPDPWTFSENAYPKELNSYLELARYTSTNYLNISFIKIFRLVFNVGKLIIFKNLLMTLIISLFKLILPQFIRYGYKPYIFISLFEYIGSLLFLKYTKNNKTDLSILFLNQLAHIQHHYWSDKYEYIHLFTLKFIDKIFKNIFSFSNEFEIIIHNGGISQKNTNNEKPWVCYRPYDQKTFLNKLGIELKSVESLMTHDAHIFFYNEKDMRNAEKILNNCLIKGKKLFKTISDRSSLKIFYTFDFFDEVANEDQFLLDNVKISFHDTFKKIVVRTGRHTNQGQIFTNKKNIFPNHEFENHYFNKYLLKYFQ